jgi:hypothetical protein
MKAWIAMIAAVVLLTSCENMGMKEREKNDRKKDENTPAQSDRQMQGQNPNAMPKRGDNE